MHYDSERGGETSTRTQKSFFYVSARIIISRSFFFLVGFGVVSSRRVFERFFCSSSSAPSAQSRGEQLFKVLYPKHFFFEFKKRPDVPPSFLRHSFVPLSRRREKHARRERERERVCVCVRKRERERERNEGERARARSTAFVFSFWKRLR